MGYTAVAFATPVTDGLRNQGTGSAMQEANMQVT